MKVKTDESGKTWIGDHVKKQMKKFTATKSQEEKRYIYIYVYIYIERERERENDNCKRRTDKRKKEIRENAEKICKKIE